jgi:hypothetical protein
MSQGRAVTIYRASGKEAKSTWYCSCSTGTGTSALRSKRDACNVTLLDSTRHTGTLPLSHDRSMRQAERPVSAVVFLAPLLN